jgi:general nucleoside transport system permease protein
VLFRSAGVLNIGLEGQLLSGAAAAAWIGPFFPASPWSGRILLLAGASVAGSVATLPALWLKERRRVPEVLSTILLNLVAAAMVTWLVRGPLRDPAGDYPQSKPLSELLRLPPLFAGSRATSACLLALLAAVAAGLFLFRTPWGLQLRAVGESPRAARAAGVPAATYRSAAFLASGALAGLAGGLEVLAVTGRLYDPFAAGIGFTGITAALLGGIRPWPAGAAALLFAALGAGAGGLQRDAGVPSALATLVPALAVLALLLVRQRPGSES